MNTLQKTKKAYEDILSLVSEYKDTVTYDYSDLLKKSECHIFGVELKETYGLDLDPTSIYSTSYNKFGDYRSIGRYGEKHRRTISWSDDGKQPEDEVLLELSFCTGAYIFGDDYPQELFNEFFQELKSYGPKYSDTVNKNLYFSLETSKNIFNDFKGILDKYYEKNKLDSRLRKVEKLKEEIEKLAEV